MTKHSLAGVFAALWLAGCSDKPIVQPIPFNHRIHAANEVTCDYCHVHALDGQRASLPRVSLCMDCHDSDITKNPDAAPFVALICQTAKAGSELPWVRLYELPHHVYFSHRRHTTIAGFKCDVCHGDMGSRESPPTAQVGRPLDMNDCLDCHDANGVGRECTWCHR